MRTITAMVAGALLLGGIAFGAEPRAPAAVQEKTVGGSGAEIAAAMAAAKPGDTIRIEAGAYEFPGVVLEQKATEEQPIVIEGVGKVVLDGKGGGGVSSGGGIILAGAERITIRNIEIRNFDHSYQGGITIRNQAAHNLVENCDIHDCGRKSEEMGGITIRNGGHHNVVRNSRLYHNYTGIYLSGGATDNLVEGCDIYENNVNHENSDGVGVYTPDCTRNVFRRNLIHQNWDDGLDLWQSAKNVVEFNVSYQNAVGGAGNGNGFKLGSDVIKAGLEPGKIGSHLVRGNIAWGNKAAGFVSNGRSNTYYNNVSVANGTYGFEDSVIPGEPGSVYLNNVAASNKLGDFASTGYLRSDYNCWGVVVHENLKPKDGTEKGEAHSIRTDPKFKDAAKADFHIGADSPLVDAGTELPGLKDLTDRDGNKIPSGKAADIGAYEFVKDAAP